MFVVALLISYPFCCYLIGQNFGGQNCRKSAKNFAQLQRCHFELVPNNLSTEILSDKVISIMPPILSPDSLLFLLLLLLFTSAYGKLFYTIIVIFLEMINYI